MPLASAEGIALFFHILGGFVFVGGAIVAAVALEAARRRSQPAQIALLLMLTRVGVRLVACGGLVVLGFGLWLVTLSEFDFGDAWIEAALALFALAAGLGAVGGQRPKRARLLATRLAREGRPLEPELRRLLDDRVSLALNYVSGALVIAILALMVWRPGS
jgi:uncharacterized membrane protein